MVITDMSTVLNGLWMGIMAQSQNCRVLYFLFTHEYVLKFDSLVQGNQLNFIYHYRTKKLVNLHKHIESALLTSFRNPKSLVRLCLWT